MVRWAIPLMGSLTEDHDEYLFHWLCLFLFLFIFVCVVESFFSFFSCLCACACLQIHPCLDKR